MPLHFTSLLAHALSHVGTTMAGPIFDQFPVPFGLTQVFVPSMKVEPHSVPAGDGRLMVTNLYPAWWDSQCPALPGEDPAARMNRCRTQFDEHKAGVTRGLNYGLVYGALAALAGVWIYNKVSG